MEQHSNFKVIIIGSGLAGSCLANGLVRSNVDVQVYERLLESTKREGYQIRLGAAALKGMRLCLSPDHLSAIVERFGRSSGLKSQAPIICGKGFEKLLDLTKFSSYDKSAPINRVVLRDALANPLSEAGKLEYGKSFDRYEIVEADTTQERVRVWFADGSHDDCDILIAADGSHSKINKQIGLDNTRQLDGYTSILAKSELPTERLLELPPSLALNPILTFADNKALYFCAYLPEMVGETGKYDQSLSSAFFGVHVPDEHLPANIDDLSSEQQWKAVSNNLEGWASEYHRMIELMKTGPMYIYKGRYSVEPSRQWRSKIQSTSEPELGHPRVWLMGDAMHAMLPNRGMGGNTALCDTATALPLLERLSNLAKKNGYIDQVDVKQALNEYEGEMMPRAFAWVKKSGGGSIVPIDTSTMLGMAFIRAAAIVLTVVAWWQNLIGLFMTDHYVDEAPELK